MKPKIDRFYRTLVHDTPDAIVYADAEGMIGFWNKGAERIFGFSAAEAVGEPLDIIIPESLRKRHWSGYLETVRTGTSRYGAGDVLAVTDGRLPKFTTKAKKPRFLLRPRLARSWPREGIDIQEPVPIIQERNPRPAAVAFGCDLEDTSGPSATQNNVLERLREETVHAIELHG